MLFILQCIYIGMLSGFAARTVQRNHFDDSEGWGLITTITFCLCGCVLFLLK